jgi:hypothetical protein
VEPHTLGKKLYSVSLIVILVLSSIVFTLPLNTPRASAVVLSHDAGNLYFNIDNHSTLNRYIAWLGTQQTDYDSGGAVDYTHFFFDQFNYDHSGDIDIATGGSYPILQQNGEEFETTASDTPLSFIEDGIVDKSYGSYTKTANINGQVNDMMVYQTAWSSQGEDWGIIQWCVVDLTMLGLNNVRFGLKGMSCVSGTNDFDTDYWDGTEKVFYIEDSGTFLGFAAADTGTPINLYKGVSGMAPLYSDENLYNAIIGSSGVSGATGNLDFAVGWTDDEAANDGFNIMPSGRGTRALVIACANSLSDLYDEIDEARQFYLSQIIMITEIADEGTPKVEVYNAGTLLLDLSNYKLSVDDGTTFWGEGGHRWNNPFVPAGGYSVWTLGGTDSFGSTEGATLSLWDTSGMIKYDEVAFGQNGIAPDPFYNPALSTIGSISKVYLGAVYSTEWVHSLHGNTFGAQNNESSVNHDPKIVLNEVMFNPTAPQYGFIELMYTGGSPVDLYNYSIVTDNIAYIGTSTILDPGDPYLNIFRNDAPWLFDNDNMSQSADNVYLYNDTGVLLDMVGWNTAHTQNTTVTRVPDGFGTYKGFSDVTSMAAGWVFDRIPTIPLVLIGPPDQIGYGDQGDEIWFNLTITSKESADDWFEIINQSLPNGWIVEIFEEDMIIKITGPIFITAGSSYNITVKITIPTIYPIGDFDNTTITVRSVGNNPAIAFSVVVQPRIYAYLEPEKFVIPSQIYVNGTGYDENATITLNITGKGMGTTLYRPQDVIFLLDNSGSMVDNDPGGDRFGAARSYTYNLGENDTAAVVTFFNSTSPGDGAWLAREPLQPAEHLMNNFSRVRDNINYTSGWVLGGTNIMLALDVGMSELTDPNYGNDTHVWVMILLTDGEDSWLDRDTIWLKADECAANDIIVFCIGLGTSADMVLLDGIAERTGGLSYPAPDPSYLEEIYQDIAARVNQIAGYDLNMSDATPMIRDVLPPWIDIIPDTFIDPATGDQRRPDVYYKNATGYWILEWNVSTISLGESWSVSFNITSSLNGYLAANNYTASRINYTNWAGLPIEKPFPKTMINVLIGEPLPPELSIEVVDDMGNPDGKGDNIRLNWAPPKTPNTDYYLIYRSTSQTGFDFSSPWINTKTDSDPWGGNEAARTSWNFTGDAGISPQEYYYAVRTVNTGGEISDTSRTVGKITTSFQQYVSTFSLPLEPLVPVWADELITDMNARYMKWMDPLNHVWVQHGDGSVNDAQLEIGQGFEIYFDTVTKYTFTGIPAAMILYDNVSLGFDADPSTGNADSLTATVDKATGNVDLSWMEPSAPGDQYLLFRSTTRDGFWGLPGVDYIQIATLPIGTTTFLDPGVAVGGTEYYYILIPSLVAGDWGSSSYSIGVWTADYSAGYDTIGIPVKLLTPPQTADWYCDEIDNAVGINYFGYTEQRWLWHSERMPANAFDTTLEMAYGYQVSTASDTKYSFIGV